MAKEFKQRFINTVQSGISSVQSAMVQQQHLGSTAFYPATLDQMDSVKSGWLRKQGGVVRSWHRRWFVLKGDYLCYYTSDEECNSGRQPLGSIFLPGNHVVEVPYNPTDSEKFQFEISSGDSDRISTTHETYLMSAESEEGRKEWLIVIKQIMYQMIGGAIFGQPLDVTLLFEQKRDKTRKVPQIVEYCVEYLRLCGLKEEGLFRLPGRSVLIRQLSEKFDRGERPSWLVNDRSVDVHSVASLLKAYLRDLPQPLIPFSLYEKVMRVITREKELIGEAEAVVKLASILDSREFTTANYNTLQYLSRFLAQVSQHSDVNKMNSLNLATVFVQSFIRPELDDPNLMLATSSQRTVATLVIIENHEKLFSTEFTHTGGAVVLGDLLGLNSGTNDTVLMSSSPSLNNDLAGLDLNFTTTQHSVTADGVVRRSRIVSKKSSDSTEALPPGGKRSNNRGGIVEDDVDCLDIDLRQSVSFSDQLLSRDDDNTLKTSSKDNERQCLTISSMETSGTLKDDEVAENRTGQVCGVAERTDTVLSSKLKPSEDLLNNISSTVNNVRPVLLPKPRQASLKRHTGVTTCVQSTGMITSVQSPVLTSAHGPRSTVDIKAPVSDVEWKLQVEQLNIKLELVVRERDVALARVKELEQELQTYHVTRP